MILATLNVSPAVAGMVDFNRDVLPILSANCFACHGPDAASRKADLRFDERAIPVESGAIAPGQAEESELIRRINSTDDDEKMPPPESKKALTAEQKAVLVRWINEGAEYQLHRSFIAPKQATLPEVSWEHWQQNPIDRFVGARLSAEGLAPCEEADRATLVRRVYLDLTGLPPSAEEALEFINDSSPHAYEELVDKLLANRHYGERMSLDWLDAARYADTNGYSIDGGRNIWLWRDWVINAFNTNLPYDQFLVQQLAGDLLPDRTDAQLIASGFQRNNMVTHEGGTIPAENLVNYNVDRVKTFGEAVLGMTLACAQCHDHKYDPISQREYYRLFAYFNTASDVGLDGDGGVNPRPRASLKTVLPADDVPKLQERKRQLAEQLAHPPLDAFAAWESRQKERLAARGRDFALHPVELLKVSTPNSGSGFGVVDNAVALKHPGALGAYDVLLSLPKNIPPVTGLRVVFTHDAEAPGGGLGYGALPTDQPPSAANTSKDGATKDDATKVEETPPGTFVLTAVSISADQVPGDQVNLNLLKAIDRVTASSWLDAYRPEGVLDLRSHDGWSPVASHDERPAITVTLKEPISSEETPFVTFQLNFGVGRSLVAGRFEIFAVCGVDDASDLPDDVVAALLSPASSRSNAQSESLLKYFSEHGEEMADVRVQLANVQDRLDALTEAFPTMIMDESPTPRETFILNRGDYAQPTDRVEPGVPASLPPLPAGAPPNRLGLAQWTVMPENPLTARLAVNRFWRLLFGTGLVATAADFGAQGEMPSHPELLDWLAVDFRQSGWNVKRLVRTIVTSAAYRQSSATTPEMLARDPANRLLERGPRFRLSAELVRDNALKVSGLLVDWVGGPSVNPYAPGDLWREVSHYGSTPATSQTFAQDHGEKLYRRSLYTYWKRTAPPPNMTAFDAPNREICTVARSVTTTPMQSLVLLNDVQFVEAARAFAERMIQSGIDDGARVQWAFTECLSRAPSESECSIVTKLLKRERARYAADRKAANDLLSAGESPRDAAIDPAEHAAWTQAAALLLNLSETVTRN